MQMRAFWRLLHVEPLCACMGCRCKGFPFCPHSDRCRVAPCLAATWAMHARSCCLHLEARFALSFALANAGQYLRPVNTYMHAFGITSFFFWCKGCRVCVKRSTPLLMMNLLCMHAYMCAPSSCFAVLHDVFCRIEDDRSFMHR